MNAFFCRPINNTVLRNNILNRFKEGDSEGGTLDMDTETFDSHFFSDMSSLSSLSPLYGADDVQTSEELSMPGEKVEVDPPEVVRLLFLVSCFNK